MRCIPIVLAAFAGAAALSITACDTPTSTQIATIATGHTTASSTALTISPQTMTLAIGAQQQLTTNAPLSLRSQVQWASSQPSVAAISPSGLVTALSVGTTQITARYSFDTATVATAAVAVTGAAGTGGTTGAGTP